MDSKREETVQLAQAPSAGSEAVKTEEFNFEEGKDYDDVREKFEIIAIKMDIHKNGILYLKELDLILNQLKSDQKDAIGGFLIAYMKQTRRQTMPLPTFVTNIQRAYDQNKFGLREMISKTEDNQIKESELQNIIQSMANISANPKPPAKEVRLCVNPKSQARNEPKSLAEKIQEQKRKLKQDSKKAPRPMTQREERKITQFRFSRKGSTKKGDIEAGQEQSDEIAARPAERKKEGGTVSVKETRKSLRGTDVAGYTQRHMERIRRTQHGAEQRPMVLSQEEEPRFDLDDYTKTATAFNPVTSLTQSFFQRAGSNTARGCPEDVSFTERLLVENSMSNVAKRKGLQIPPRAMSTEERAFSKCTFRPELYKSPSKYSNIQPRLLSHFDQPPVDLKKLPKTDQVLPNLNRSFQSVMVEPVRNIQKYPPSRRSLSGMSSFEGMENSGYGKRSGSRQGFGDISGIVTIRDCFNTFNVNVFDKPTENFFDVKSNKKLDYILRHGYSFKYHEKKHFNAKKSVDAFKKANKDFLNMTMQNKSLMNYMQPKPLSKENSLSMSMSSQNLYAELFNDRYRKLTQNIMFNAQDPEMPQQNELIEESKGEVVSEELNNAKRNRMYKDLGMNLNLREIFGGLSYEDLTKLKKLHVLHATQRAKQKERDQQEAK